MSEVVETGRFQQRCRECQSLFSYEWTDTYTTRDYLGDLNDGRYVECPVCKRGQRAEGRQVDVAAARRELEAKLTDLGLEWWGSDCTYCGNATHASMKCDDCGSDNHTVGLWRLR